MKSTILIYGGGLQAISTARSLNEIGYSVGVYTHHKDYVSKSDALNFYIVDNHDFDVDKLCAVISLKNIVALIPMSDQGALVLSKNKKLIMDKTHCKVCVPDYNTLIIASDKLKLMKLCAENGFPHPITLQESDLDTVNINSLTFPVLIKPNHSVGARGIVKINNAGELLDKLHEIKDIYGNCHVQEFISGNRPYYNVMIYRDKSGNIINYVILEIERYYPISGGSSCFCKTIEDPILLKLCKDVLEKLEYVGFADFDVLQNTEGEYKIIEINPRVPASLRGAAISGVNFPGIIVGDALGITNLNNKYLPGKYLRYLGLDIMWFISSPNRFKIKPSWFKFFGRNLFYQEGGWKDWKVMLYALLGNLKKIEFKGGKFRKKE